MPFDPSQLDTSVGALIRSGAALLGITLGAFVLAAKPRTRFTRFFGALLLVDGVGYAVFALAGGYSGFPHKELIVPSHVVSVAAASSAAGLLLTAFWPDVRRLPQHRISLVISLAAATAVVLLFPVALLIFGRPELESSALADYATDLQQSFGIADSIAYGAYLAASCLVGMALLVRVRLDAADPRARASLLVSVYFIANAVIMAGVYLAGISYGIDWLIIAMLLVTAAVLVLLPLGFLGLGAVGGWSRWVPTGLLLACLATAPVEALLDSSGPDRGFGGIVSLLCLMAIGYAIFRLDLLGVVVPRPKAGLLAAIGLATLFITAQVAQNFLSDELGLLAGGVVAGGAVFAAYPIQRAAERTLERDVKRGPAAEYRTLVEHAWSDGHFGPKERLMLSETRRRLGLAAEAAQAIEDDVARKHARTAA